jgi:uncharacterized protein DUF1552
MARRIGRRLFLQGAGGVLVGLPVLTSLLPRGQAGGSTGPKRFLAMLSCSGQINTQWYPIHTPTGYQLTDQVFANYGSCPGRPCKQDGTTYLHTRLPEDNRYAYAPLTDFQTDTGISTILHEALNPFLPKMTLLRGIDFLNTVGHSSGSPYLGNYNASGDEAVRAACPATTTIDEVMAYSSKLYPSTPAMRALHFACGWPDAGSATNYGIAGGPVELVNGYQDPWLVWQELFLGLTPPDPQEPKVDPNLSFLNTVYEDYHRLATSPRIGTHDRQLLERHVAFLAEIEAKIKNFQAVECTQPVEPPSINATPQLADPEQLGMAIQLMVDLSVAAIICDLTRVVTINVTNALHDGEGSWQTSLHNSADVPSDWHHYAHDAFGTQSSMNNLIALNRWITKDVFARLLTQLDVPEDVDGSTFLDNSLVVWGNELSLSHYNVTMPTVMAGSAGGAVNTNRYIDYCDWANGEGNPIEHGVLIAGLPHNRLLVSCMQAMGLAPSDYEQDGVAGYGSTAYVPSVNGWDTSWWDMDHIHEPLPGMLTA